MPSKNNKSVNKTSGSTKRTVHLGKPLTKSGKIDKRYSTPQFIKKNGTRDKRTTHSRLC